VRGVFGPHGGISFVLNFCLPFNYCPSMTTSPKANDESVPEPQIFTWDEIKKHNKETDLWVVYKGDVIDVTKFQKEHPGGAEVLQDHAGQDITEPFENIGHPPYALEVMARHKIGIVKEPEPKATATQQKTQENKDVKTTKKEQQEGGGLSGKFLVSLLVVVVAVLGYWFLRR
jgi:cytochrome b involved in lipid metabolism